MTEESFSSFFFFKLKNSWNNSASTVADEIIIFSEGRLRAIFFSSPNTVSVRTLRSCASSTMITPYCVSSGSASISLRRIPSVMYFILVVSGLHFDTNRMETPTVSPLSSPRSVATRSASVIAEMRRGSVTPIKPLLCHPNSYRYCGLNDRKKYYNSESTVFLE